MSALALNAMRWGREVLGRVARITHALELQERVLLDQKEFLRQVCVERKRSERSQRAFMLMLIDGCGLFATDGAGSVREQVATALPSITRETDVLGWYKDNSVMAVLFTELCDPPSGATQVIYTKVLSGIRQRISDPQAQQLDISVHLFPELPDDDAGGGPSDLTLYPDLTQRAESKKVAHGIKRMVDITGSLIALILLSPVMLAVSLAIKLTSKGPVIFRQARLGQYSKAFTFLKFRSMYVNCDPKIHQQYIAKLIAGAQDASHSSANGNAVYKIEHDPRVTRVGRFLRKTSLDELPQFFNVLRGDMSLVGPRPPLPYEVERYGAWHRRRILEARPGITGLWQVNGRSRTSFDDMVRLDLKYIETASLLLDLKILLQTPRAVFSGDGAY